MNLEETQLRRNPVTLSLTTAGFSTGEKYLTNTQVIASLLICLLLLVRLLC